MKFDRKQMTYVFFGGLVLVALLFYGIVIFGGYPQTPSRRNLLHLFFPP